MVAKIKFRFPFFVKQITFTFLATSNQRMSDHISIDQSWNYWGKAKPEDEGEKFHRLVYHSLDVAAVGVAFLQQSPALLDLFCSRLRCSRAAMLSWAGFFLALHDLGKFSNTFQSQRADLLATLRGEEGSARNYSERHDTLGFWIWKDQVRDGILDELDLAGAKQALNHWMRAVCGHHGMPPIPSGKTDYHFLQQDEKAVTEFIKAMAQLLLNEEARFIPELTDNFEDNSQSLSWWFAGLTVLADWLGSNTQFFPYHTEPRGLKAYWDHVLVAAQKALTVSGVLPVPVAPDKTLHDFFSYIEHPSPLQAWAQNVELRNVPQIFLLEDVTGAGKTEAAMILAYRLMAQGAAQGFFIGLPTMATANAMYGRVAEVYQKLFAGNASLALGHGFKDLVDSFASSVLPASVTEGDAAQLDDTASARCTAWLADHNKRVLLSPAGVGTVDQALLAVLHSKHQSLRLLGLFNKVLIIDEVHACDIYMEGILKVLLRFHASMGGSAILLSATLPNKMKSALLRAYAEGSAHGLALPQLEKAYPLATRWCQGDAHLLQDALGSRPNVSRTVKVRYLSDESQVHSDILNALAEGKCVGWIRNTVGDAVDAYTRFAGDVDPEKITLFHARFALGDRLKTEEKVLEVFGEKSTADQRRGRLMIATQVAEQSLDVDFDVLVSDLAPIDRLLQRAGRAHRHTRDAFGERLRAQDAKDDRGGPSLWVLAPPWTDAPARDWYAAQFKTAQYVYNRHDELWLSAKALQEGQFSMPGDARRLIEMVYSGEEEVPTALVEGAVKAEGEGWAHASQAQMNTLSFENGYARGEVGDWWADTKTPSRLGEETREVMLAKWDNGCLQRWDERGWPYSMVKVLARKMGRIEFGGDVGLLHAHEEMLKTLPSEGKYCVLLPLSLQADGCWQGQVWTAAKDERDKSIRLLTWLYDADLGLRIKKSDAADTASD